MKTKSASAALVRRSEETSRAIWNKLQNMSLKKLKAHLHFVNDDRTAFVYAKIEMQLKGNAEFCGVRLKITDKSQSHCDDVIRIDIFSDFDDGMEIAKNMIEGYYFSVIGMRAA